MGIGLYITVVGQIQWEFLRSLSKKGAIESNCQHMKFTSHKKGSRKCPTTMRTPANPGICSVASIAHRIVAPIKCFIRLQDTLAGTFWAVRQHALLLARSIISPDRPSCTGGKCVALPTQLS